MYLRIKDGPKIEITAPLRTPEKTIKKFINSSICKIFFLINHHIDWI